MLFRDGVAFSVGLARFEDRPGGDGEETAKIYIRIEPEALGNPILAQLDTGSPWLVLQAEVAEAMSLLDGDGPEVRLRTRFGPISGRLERTVVNILAEEGETLQLEATAFVSRQWNAGTFAGYSGLLERVRFAIDPDPAKNLFYFGPA